MSGNEGSGGCARGSSHCIMQADDFFKRIGAMRATFRLALREGLLGAIIGRWKKSAEDFAVRADAAGRHAAEARAMIAALAKSSGARPAIRLARANAFGCPN
jgi:hypothetical protein